MAIQRDQFHRLSVMIQNKVYINNCLLLESLAENRYNKSIDDFQTA